MFLAHFGRLTNVSDQGRNRKVRRDSSARIVAGLMGTPDKVTRRSDSIHSGGEFSMDSPENSNCSFVGHSDRIAKLNI